MNLFFASARLWSIPITETQRLCEHLRGHAPNLGFTTVAQVIYSQRAVSLPDVVKRITAADRLPVGALEAQRFHSVRLACVLPRYLTAGGAKYMKP